MDFLYARRQVGSDFSQKIQGDRGQVDCSVPCQTLSQTPKHTSAFGEATIVAIGPTHLVLECQSHSDAQAASPKDEGHPTSMMAQEIASIRVPRAELEPMHLSGWTEVSPLGKSRFLLQWPSETTALPQSSEQTDQPEQLAGLTALLGWIRKGQHIDICLNQDVEAADKFTGFERVHILPQALPDEGGIPDTKARFLGQSFAAPLLITGMTGGLAEGATINRRLARCAQELGIPMGVGSQRIAIEDSDYRSIFSVKRDVPGVFLIGNLGMGQLTGAGSYDRCMQAIEMIEADALAIHINTLQESIQVEGDHSFHGLKDRLSTLIPKLPCPVLIKEVGCGMDAASAAFFIEAGAAAIDVGGRGGTSWGHIEGLRAQSPGLKRLGRVFRDWGIPTAYSLAALKTRFPDFECVATGGLRTGLDVAKAVGLGASMAGIGLPVFRAARESEEGALVLMRQLKHELQIAMQSSGCSSLAQLEQRICLGMPYSEALDEWAQRYRQPKASTQLFDTSVNQGR